MPGFERLFDWYRETIGEPDREIDLYVGFTLFFVGVLTALVGLGFFAGAELAENTDTHFYLREFAFVAGGLALPTVLLSVVILLPVDRRAIAVGTLGMIIVLGAIAFFIQNYPHNWNLPGDSYSEDASLHGMAIYSAGTLLLAATTAAALVSYHVERTRELEEAIETDGEDGKEVTDEQVRQDIDDAMDGSDLTWGGIYEDSGSPDITVTMDESTELTGNLEGKTVKTTETVEKNVESLSAMMGGPKEDTFEDSTSTQAEALAELRRKQEEGEAPVPEQPNVVIRFVRNAKRRVSQAISGVFGSDDEAEEDEGGSDEDGDGADPSESETEGETEDEEFDPLSTDDDDDESGGLDIDLDPDIDLDENAGTDFSDTFSDDELGENADDDGS